MQLKGMEQLREHVPDLNSASGRIRLALLPLGVFILTTFYFILSDNIPTWSIDSQIIVTALGFLVMNLFFIRKEAYKTKYGELAYRNAFLHFWAVGLTVIFSTLIHAAYMNGPHLPRGWWIVVISVLGWYFFIVGTILWARGILVFGVDNLALLYVYHPEDGQIINSSIFSILRHPIYAGVLRIGMGLALINGNGNSLAYALLFPLLFFGFVTLSEEKDLIERFGQSYLDYRKHVPAFWPKLRDLVTFIKFVITGA